MSVRRFAAFFMIVSYVMVATATADERAAKSPHYVLSPGREFTFHNETHSEGKKEGSVYIVDWKVWAIDRDPDGAWRLVIRCDLKTKRNTASDQPDQARIDTLVWRSRMFEDGRLVGATTMGTVRDPFRLFPQLPANPNERNRGWESRGDEKTGVRFHHTLTPSTESNGENLAITTRAEGPEDRVYELTHEYRATFDARRGVVSRVETKDTSGYPSRATTLGTIELTGIENRGEAWAKTFGREADRYFDAVDAYDASSNRAVRDAAHCKEILAEAKTALTHARSGLTTPLFQEAIAQKIKGHDRMLDYDAKQAIDRAARLGKTAEGWEAKDIEGKTHRLADYRGKVVVMDFWYRGCGWCMHAMPQVIRLSETFRNQAVVVLGMTTDENDKDARVVIDAMGIKYPTIKASGIPEKYGVDGFPTLIVIDQEGKVREIHVGYSPRLYEDLSRLIRDVLAHKPAA